MDAKRFDAVAKALISATSRRRTLGALLGGALGLLSLTDRDGAWAAKSGKCKPKCTECEKCDKGKCKRKNGKKRCKKGKCRPKQAGTPCTASPGGSCQNGICVNLKADEANCGSLGNDCGSSQICQEGSCFPRSTCPETTTTFTYCLGGPTCGPSCSCGRSAEGNVLCLADDDDFCASGARCTTRADCPTGKACVDVSGCCITGTPPGSKACLNRCAAPSV